jgi:catechol 2,3-dioxygenase-like lactoylglutathione lyase family enzyme
MRVFFYLVFQEIAMAEVAPPITSLVPFLPVQNIERSAAFYKLLGFEVGNRQPREGVMGWAWLYIPEAPNWKTGANLMLSCSDRPGSLAAPGMLFYVYVSDLIALREKLLGSGLEPGPISYPFYLPKGECEIRDPDGHTLMLAQRDTDTP